MSEPIVWRPQIPQLPEVLHVEVDEDGGIHSVIDYGLIVAIAGPDLRDENGVLDLRLDIDDESPPASLDG